MERLSSLFLNALTKKKEKADPEKDSNENGSTDTKETD
jgi:hypothetical protein